MHGVAVPVSPEDSEYGTEGGGTPGLPCWKEAPEVGGGRGGFGFKDVGEA